MVTISIIAIVSSIILFNFPSFASRILLENLTHEIALVVRQAQVYGIGIKQTTGGLFPAYGAHFDTTATPPEDPPNKKVIFFADTIADGFYGGDSEKVETFTIQRGNAISVLCYKNVNDITWQCGADNLDITFKRPEPEAHILINRGGGDVSSARITVTSPNAEVGDRYITVHSSGQIAVTSTE